MNRDLQGLPLAYLFDNFVIAHGVQNTSIKGEVMQLLRKTAMLCAEHDIEVQAHWIPTKQGSLADMLSRGQYTIYCSSVKNPSGIP